MVSEHERVARAANCLLPHVVDRLARERPNARYGEWVMGSGVTIVTYAELANVVNGLAWSLIDQLGGPGSSETHPAVLTYVGPNDVRYSAMVFAAAKVGYVLFATSPRNSTAAHRALFDRLQCQTLVTSDPVPPAASTILEAIKPPRHLKVPSIEELFEKRYPPYVLDKDFQHLRHKPFIVL
ncbi:hypothetical protein SLS62_002500 [Diatrype stigma]|uniref:AMP-dependent synthetase/ligase domain-containing protein n=1 Tax=Diatrype stigma TaxID=117547 RepID=A0AAN9UXW5_9PEZI